MAFAIKDRVAETTVTTGTGTVTLLGAQLGFQSFSAIGNGNTTMYLILSGNGTDWETGIGTYTSAGTTLSRTTILSSSNSGSAISLVGTSLVLCSMNSHITDANGLFNQLFGSPTNGNYSLTVTGGVWTVTAAAASSASGLFNQNMSATPTSAGTGLTTWINQGSSTITDDLSGIKLTRVGVTGFVARSKAAPATPYSFRALVANNSPPDGTSRVAGIGWYDGANKLHLIDFVFSNTTGWGCEVARWTSPTSFSSTTDFGKQNWGVGNPVWLKIRDDGTTVYFMYSYSGDDSSFVTAFSIAKTSGWNGASGYSNVLFGCNDTVTSAALMSWSQGT